MEPAEGCYELTITGRSTLLRISVSVPSGGKISEPAVKGPASLKRVSEIETVSEDGPAIGALRKEFVFKSKGAGEVTISIKTTSPTGEDGGEVYKVTWK